MRWSEFFKSSLGEKYLMALTGLGLTGFAVAHLLGNLQIFCGPDKINHYAETLKNLGPLLWVARLGLLAIFFTHVVLAVRLSRHNCEARPIKYYKKIPLQSTLASRTMALSGALILLYVIFHLLHYTFFAIHPEYAQLLDKNGRHDVYNMLILGFQQPLISCVYFFSIVVLGLHLSHGLSSVLQTLGLNNSRYRNVVEKIGPVVGWTIALGYISIPAAVLLGLLKQQY